MLTLLGSKISWVISSRELKWSLRTEGGGYDTCGVPDMVMDSVVLPEEEARLMLDDVSVWGCMGVGVYGYPWVCALCMLVCVGGAAGGGCAPDAGK